MSAESLLYLYGVVNAGAPPPSSVTGIDGGNVRLIDAGDMCAIVSDVSAAEYGEAQLDERLTDIPWVGERGVAHERVLTWFVDRGPVVPFSLFSLHASEEALRERLSARHAALRATLDRLDGHREWTIRVWRDEERFAAHLADRSEALRALDAEIAAAGEGRRFLLQRKRETLVGEEARRATGGFTERVYGELSRDAADSRALPLAVPPARTTRTLVMYAAFLVADARYAGFHARVQELAGSKQSLGFDWEFTGPWPAYHFSDTGSS